MKCNLKEVWIEELQVIKQTDSDEDARIKSLGQTLLIEALEKQGWEFSESRYPYHPGLNTRIFKSPRMNNFSPFHGDTDFIVSEAESFALEITNLLGTRQHIVTSYMKLLTEYFLRNANETNLPVVTIKLK